MSKLLSKEVLKAIKNDVIVRLNIPENVVDRYRCVRVEYYDDVICVSIHQSCSINNLISLINYLNDVYNLELTEISSDIRFNTDYIVLF